MRSYCYEEVGKQLAMNRPAKKCTRTAFDIVNAGR
jgi:hypothetical protein